MNFKQIPTNNSTWDGIPKGILIKNKVFDINTMIHAHLTYNNSKHWLSYDNNGYLST